MTVHLLCLCGLGDVFSHLARLPALQHEYPDHTIRFYLGGYGKSPQLSKEQINREGYEATVIKNLCFHSQLPKIREMLQKTVVKEGDIFQDWSYCEEIFANKEPPMMQYDIEFPHEHDSNADGFEVAKSVPLVFDASYTPGKST